MANVGINEEERDNRQARSLQKVSERSGTTAKMVRRSAKRGPD